MNDPTTRNDTHQGKGLTHVEAVRLARQLAAERPGWVCEVMQDPSSDEWLLCLYHSEWWEQFVRSDPALLDSKKSGFLASTRS